jgi:uncharacterized protein
MFVKQTIGAKQVRVRDVDGVAKIEVGTDELHLLQSSTFDELFAKLKSIGFASVILDSEGYRPGKINVIAD